MKNIFKTFVKYGYLNPFHLCGFIYNNYLRNNIIRDKGKILSYSSSAKMDLDRTAKVFVKRNVVLGWCDMKRTRMETSIFMNKNSELVMGGGTKSGSNLIGYGSFIAVGNNAKLHIGDCFINREVKLICNKEITIGDDCIIAMGAVIRDNDGGTHKIINDYYMNAKPIHIGDHVWIGENAIILKGVSIGEGSVIAAGSLVSKDVPSHCIVGGNPARILRENVKWMI